MKHLKTFFVTVLSLILLSSCSTVRVFSVNTLKGEYDVSSTSKAKSTKNIKVYYDDKEIPQPYKVLSVGSYNPISIPLISSAKKKMQKHLVEKAVSAAAHEGGNAVYIQADSHFKILIIE